MRGDPEQRCPCFGEMRHRQGQFGELEHALRRRPTPFDKPAEGGGAARAVAGAQRGIRQRFEAGRGRRDRDQPLQGLPVKPEAQVGGVQRITGEAVTAIGEIVETIEEVNAISGDIVAAVEQQAVATREIAQNAQSAAAGTEEVSRNIGGVERAAGESGQAAEEVLTSAGELGRLSDTLTGEVERFLAEIRAG